MKKHLRLMLALCAMMVCLGANAQKPASGVYKVQNVGSQKYVQMKGKFYARPDVEKANVSDASDVTIGVGVQEADGSYKLYSLASEYNGETVEVFEYIDKAIQMVKTLTYAKVQNRFGDNVARGEDVFSNIKWSQDILNQIDSTCNDIFDAYQTDYAYFNLETVKLNDNDTIVRIKVEIPSVPHLADIGCRAMTADRLDAWTWVKNKVKTKIATKGDANLQNLVNQYLDQLEPGTTYYLTTHKTDNNTFDFCKASDVKGYGSKAEWRLGLVELAAADKLQGGTYAVKNVGTEKVVQVLNKYYGRPNVDEATLTSGDATIDQLARVLITADGGRIDRNNENLYQLSKLTGYNADGIKTIDTGVNKMKSLIEEKLKGKESAVTEMINGYFYDHYFKYMDQDEYLRDSAKYDYTADMLYEDFAYGVELYKEAFGNYKVIDNTDGTVSLYITLPRIPAFLDALYTIYRNDGEEHTVWDFMKNMIVKYFESNPHTSEGLSKAFVERNLDKVKLDSVYNTTYFLYADRDADGTFDFQLNEGKDGNIVAPSDKKGRWGLVDPSAYSAKGYYRINNVAGFGEQSYLNVKSMASAQPELTNDEKYTAPGSVFYISVKPENGQLAIQSLRSQGQEIVKNNAVTDADYEEWWENFKALVAGNRDEVNTPVGAIELVRFLMPRIFEYVGQSEAEGKKIMAELDSLNDMNVYLQLTTTESGEPAFYAHAMVPTMKSMMEIYDNHKEALDGAATTLFNLVGSPEKGAQFIKIVEGGDTTQIWNLFKKEIISIVSNKVGGQVGEIFTKYINRIHTGVDYYLIQGDMPQTEGGQWTANGTLGFCNNRSNYFYGDGELVAAGDGARWFLEPVDEENPFAVAPREGMKGLTDEKYYTSLFVDFPFKLASDVIAYKIVDEWTDNKAIIEKHPEFEYGSTKDYYVDGGVKYDAKYDGVDGISADSTYRYALVPDSASGQTYAYHYVKVVKVDSIVPTQTPVILECSSLEALDNAIVPVQNPETDKELTFLRGIFFARTLPSYGLLLYGFDGLEEVYPETIRVFSKNESSIDHIANNPIGFWRYSGNTISGNKAFALVDEELPVAANNVKIVLLAGDDETTGIANLVNEMNGVSNVVEGIYDLQGRKVNNPVKGLYIVNGKKMVIK